MAPDQAPPTGHLPPSTPWRRELLIQCYSDEVDAVRPLTDRPGGGLVITSRPGQTTRDLWLVVRHLRQTGYLRPVLLDANRYAGERRLSAAAPFDQQWISCQRNLGLPVLTDSGYLAPHDDAGLRTVLRRAADLGDATATLALHTSWLTQTDALQTLLGHVREKKVPVALVLEHTGDPFEEDGAVNGLLGLLASDVPVLLLRSDVSALGALACGAHAAATGTQTALRHLHPACSDPWPPIGTPSVLVGQCLTYRRLDTLAAAVDATRDSGIWRCTCPTCQDCDLDWFTALSRGEQFRLTAEHSLTALLDLREHLVGDDRKADAASWREHCRSALFRCAQADWEEPPALRHWLETLE